MALTDQQRSEILKRHLAEWTQRGYILHAETGTTAQLVLPTHRSAERRGPGCLPSLLTLGVYPVLHFFMAKKRDPRSIYIEIDTTGRANLTKT